MKRGSRVHAKVACSALITLLCGKLPTFEVLIKPHRKGLWVTGIYDSTVVWINSSICITHQHQNRLSTCTCENYFCQSVPSGIPFRRTNIHLDDLPIFLVIHITWRVVPRITIPGSLGELCSSHCPTKKRKGYGYSFKAIMFHPIPNYPQKSQPYWSFWRWVTPRLTG